MKSLKLRAVFCTFLMLGLMPTARAQTPDSAGLYDAFADSAATVEVFSVDIAGGELTKTGLGSACARIGKADEAVNSLLELRKIQSITGNLISDKLNRPSLASLHLDLDSAFQSCAYQNRLDRKVLKQTSIDLTDFDK